jgi:hypothetical protein
MPEEKEQEELERQEATHFIDDLIVYKVDLVKHPATGDKFITVRDSEGEIIDRELSNEEMDELKEALLSNGDVSVIRLGKSEEVNREDKEEENEMATKESKLVPKDEVKREKPDTKEEAIKEEEKEDSSVESEETKREQNPEEAPPPTAVSDDKLVEQKVSVSVDMSRTEEAVSKIVDSVGVISTNVDKIVERNEKMEETVTKLKETVDKLSKRTDELERSSEVTNSLPEDEGENTPEETKRGKKKNFWEGVL